jgi:hypothetical protein
VLALCHHVGAAERTPEGLRVEACATAVLVVAPSPPGAWLVQVLHADDAPTPPRWHALHLTRPAVEEGLLQHGSVDADGRFAVVTRALS